MKNFNKYLRITLGTAVWLLCLGAPRITMTFDDNTTYRLNGWSISD